jgi:hypothetical protein
MIDTTYLQSLPTFEVIGVSRRTPATLRNLRSRSHERRIVEPRRNDRFFAGLLKTGQGIFIQPK